MDVLGDWPLSELVPWLESMDRRGKPIACVGVGTERLHRDESRRTVAEKLGRIVRHWTVRCQRDRDRLEEYGVESETVTVAADMAWLLHPVPHSAGPQALARLGIRRSARLVGVNLTNEAFVAERDPHLFDKFAAALDIMIGKNGWQILFLANEVREDDSFDLAASKKVLRQMVRQDGACIVPTEYRSPQEMMEIIAACDLTIGMRYHFCLFSALQTVPFIAVERSEKVADLCWDLGWEHRAALGTLEGTDLVRMADDIVNHDTILRQRLAAALETMRERAGQNRAALDEVARG
jgi:polysaccharide pyruvyl transferase WcaK-like protein